MGNLPFSEEKGRGACEGGTRRRDIGRRQILLSLFRKVTLKQRHLRASPGDL